MRRAITLILLLAAAPALGGCLVAAVGGAAVGAAVGVTGAVVGTTAKVGKAAVGAAIPDHDKDTKKKRRD